MELGLLQDDRAIPGDDDVFPELLPLGQEVREVLLPELEQLNLTLAPGEEDIPTSRMREAEGTYNAAVRNRIETDPAAAKIIRSAILRMPAVRQMLAFLYHVARQETVARSLIYENFFQAPFVQRFMEQEGIEEATPEASKRRCPFLLNLLDALGVIGSAPHEITIRQVLITPQLVESHAGEDEALSLERVQSMKHAWPDRPESLSEKDLSILRELFGKELFSRSYSLAHLPLVAEL